MGIAYIVFFFFPMSKIECSKGHKAVKGKCYPLNTVVKSTRPGKKFMVVTTDGVVHFGAEGYTISPGTPKGDSYCARSSGIKSGSSRSANYYSRRMWGCVGGKSIAGRALKLGGRV
jgi:hypothetical protein